MDKLEFPSLSMDAWAQTAPMVYDDEADAPVSGQVPPCPWGFEMMSADCSIDRSDGVRLVGQMLQWDPAGHRCLILTAPDFVETTLPLVRLRMVTLTRVMPPGSMSGALGWDQSGQDAGPVAYELELDDGTVLQDVALHHVARPEGHYLARRQGTAGAFVRFFVPKRAVRRAAFKSLAPVPFTLDTAAAPAGARPTPFSAEAPVTIKRFEPVTTLMALQNAVAAQSSQPVQPLGEILISLELITPARLSEVLNGAHGHVNLPLGERLLRLGLVTAEGLQRALHLKMNYPMVDLRRYPINAALFKRLPYARAVELDVLPLERLEDGRLVVVLDDPGRLPTLKSLRVLFDAPLVACMPWQDSVRRFLPIAYGVRDIGGSGVGWFG